MTHPIPAPANGLAQPAWLAENLHRDDVVVLDCTANIVADENGHERVVAERGAFVRAHVPGAQFVDLQGQLSDSSSPYNFMLPSAARFQQALRDFGIHRDTTVVVYSTGNSWWATRIWWMFREFGLDNAFVLDGGIKRWQQLGLPTEEGEPRSRAAGSIAVGKPRGLVIDGDTLRARLEEPALALVNALPPAKFSGESPVHGGRPGHIPGSVNVPAARLTDPQSGLFLPAEQLAEILQDAGLLDSKREVVAYCGGGISATQVIFALALAGRDDVKLYDASLSEWAHRDGFPLHTTTQQ